MTDLNDRDVFGSFGAIEKELSTILSSINTIKLTIDQIERHHRHTNKLNSILRSNIEKDIVEYAQKIQRLSDELRHASNRLRGLDYASLDYRQQADTISAMVKEKLTEA